MRGYTLRENCPFLSHQVTVASGSMDRGRISSPTPISMQGFGLAWTAQVCACCHSCDFMCAAARLCPADTVLVVIHHCSSTLFMAPHLQ